MAYSHIAAYCVVSLDTLRSPFQLRVKKRRFIYLKEIWSDNYITLSKVNNSNLHKNILNKYLQQISKKKLKTFLFLLNIIYYKIFVLISSPVPKNIPLLKYKYVKRKQNYVSCYRDIVYRNNFRNSVLISYLSDVKKTKWHYNVDVSGTSYLNPAALFPLSFTSLLVAC